MKDNKTIKIKIWVYAVILFTSAFIVLLLTAYSQIKLNRNIDDYKSQIYSNENEKNKVQLNFANAQEINKKLQEDKQKLEGIIKNLSENLELLKREKTGIEKNFENEIALYEKLCDAQTEYSKGNVVQCARILGPIDGDLLSGKAAEMYRLLIDKANNEAGKQLYDEGYSVYKSGDYIAATDKFLLSWEFEKNGDYSDKCLFYLAYAEQKSGHTPAAVEHMKILMDDYSGSTYIKSAQRFIKKYAGQQP